MSFKIALVFDFDDTLAHDSTSDFLDSIGVDVERFWGIENQRLLEQGWNPIPAYLYQIIRLSQSLPEGKRITQEKLAAFGEKVRLFKGVPRIFKHLQDFATTVDKHYILEFYVISSGIGEILRHSKIANLVNGIFSSDFHYNEKGEIDFPRRVMSFTDKTRYLFQISKGFVGAEFEKDPFAVNRRVNKLEIPITQMIFVGDGFTDVPCFSIMNQNGGTALAVVDRKNVRARKKAWGFVEDGRVVNLHSANYNTDSDLVLSLEMAITAIINKSKLQKNSIFDER